MDITCLNNLSWPLKLKDHTTGAYHELPPGVPRSIPKSTMDRYMAKPLIARYVDAGLLIVGSDSPNNRQRDAAAENRELEQSIREDAKAAEPGRTRTKKDLVEMAQDLGIDVDPAWTKSDLATAIEMASESKPHPDHPAGQPTVNAPPQ